MVTPESRTLPEPLPIAGVASALLIARTQGGSLNRHAFERQLAFLLKRGIRSFAVNGATGEYTLTSEEEFSAFLELTRKAIGPELHVVAGIGAPSVARVRRMSEIAAEEECDGLLLPMPYFFPYAQDDLKVFVEQLGPVLQLPTYLYNLPSFTTPIEPSTAVELIQAVSPIVGIKDSSGQLDTLRLLRKTNPRAGCIIGHDGALQAALAEGVCDGVVSGVSCVLPELMTGLYKAASTDARSNETAGLKAALDALITWLNKFPVPWGLKIIAELRELGEAFFPLPLSAEKQQTRAQFIEWFQLHRSDLRADDDRL